MDTLENIYYNPKHPAGYTGLTSLSRETKQALPHVKKWLSEQDTYTLHKPVIRKFPRRKTIVGGIDFQWQADLVDVSKLKQYNKQYKYLLTVIDVFSRFAWAIPLKNKQGKSLVQAFKQIFRQGRKCLSLQTDKGSEFNNKVFQKWLQKHKVHFFTTHNEETKASLVERFNRTLKTRMWKYFTRNNTNKHIDVISSLVNSYNNSYHRTIKTRPNLVNKSNEQDLWQLLYENKNSYKKPKYKIGDMVRISKFKKQFRKGYLPNWSEELFVIVDILHTRPAVYKIADLDNEILEGTWYEQEIQKITKSNNIYKVEKVL
jgi:hypothetical protein